MEIALGLFAIALALVVPFFVESLRRPALDIETVAETVDPALQHRFLHLRAINKPCRILPWVNRDTAVDASITMTFYDRSGRTCLFGPIEGKWDVGPECLTPLVHIQIPTASNPMNISRINTFNQALIPSAHRANLPSDYEGKSFGVVVKHQNQVECYAFNGWSYQFNNWANPAWRLGIGEFIIRITVQSGRASTTSKFLLSNSG
jgi:hypothetical protein